MGRAVELDSVLHCQVELDGVFHHAGELAGAGPQAGDVGLAAPGGAGGGQRRAALTTALTNERTGLVCADQSEAISHLLRV